MAAMAAVSMSVILGDGCSSRLWTDSWAPVGPLCHFAPNLFVAISGGGAGKRRSVRDGLFQNRWARSPFRCFANTSMSGNCCVVWRSIPCRRTASSGNGLPMVNTRPRPPTEPSSPGRRRCWALKRCGRPKHRLASKFFFWLAIHRRLWTAERRKRHGLQDDDAFVLCGQAAETGDHLFLGCVLARELWFSLLAPVGLTALVPEGADELGSWWLQQRLRLDNDARPAFDSLMLLISWSIWMERNNRTFSRSVAGTQEMFRKVLREAEEWVHAGFKMLAMVCPIYLVAKRRSHVIRSVLIQ